MNAKDKEILDRSVVIVAVGLRLVEKELANGNNGLPWPKDSPEYDYLYGAREGLLRVEQKLRRR